MSITTAKKARERHLLAQFLRATSLESPVKLREAPDFEIEVEGRRVGIEITEVFQGTPQGELSLQAIAAISNEIAQRARILYSEAGGLPLRVTLNFSRPRELGQVRKDQASEALVGVVRRMLEDPDTSLEWRPRFPEDADIARIFSYVRIYRLPETFQAHWIPAAAGWQAPLEPHLIQAAISEKSRLLETYCQSVPEVWLVVAILGRDPSQFFGIDTSKLDAPMKSPFQRTYFLDAFRAKALQLHTTP